MDSKSKKQSNRPELDESGWSDHLKKLASQPVAKDGKTPEQAIAEIIGATKTVSDYNY
ncbi:hypothetical protein PQ472_05155 [Lacticaseibacillus pabuli]|uniref:Uncharacterized protein n=1 Tax=Lacticaseibacillus pabuli TaxID=3025672 RepID=A0ABY7WTZ8_9LACO|nr:hypothetical protein [Lacticaseibacillus sp. KACC 23028]WDF83625.1 hypothetical protein PQ472_05155 [Lacticaseibacillus sp. KACC 23028]